MNHNANEGKEFKILVSYMQKFENMNGCRQGLEFVGHLGLSLFLKYLWSDLPDVWEEQIRKTPQRKIVKFTLMFISREQNPNPLTAMNLLTILGWDFSF